MIFYHHTINYGLNKNSHILLINIPPHPMAPIPLQAKRFALYVMYQWLKLYKYIYIYTIKENSPVKIKTGISSSTNREF